MDDLISRAAAIDVIVFNSENRFAVDVLNELPAVDAVPVVRCRDCKYGESETNGRGEDMVMCQNKLNPIGYEDWLMPPEFFCADGERRESE